MKSKYETNTKQGKEEMTSKLRSDSYTSLDGAVGADSFNQTNIHFTRSQTNQVTKKLNEFHLQHSPNQNMPKKNPSVILGKKSRKNVATNYEDTKKPSENKKIAPNKEPAKSHTAKNQQKNKSKTFCSVCKNEINAHHKKACCISCENNFHSKCLMLDKHSNVNSSWKCNRCTSNDSCDLFEDCYETLNFHEIENIREPTIKDLQLAITSIQNSMSFMNKSFEDVLKNQKALTTENRLLKVSLKRQEEEIIILKKETEIYRTELNKADQKIISSNIILSNMPSVTNLVKHKIITEVANKLDIEPSINAEVATTEIKKNNDKYDYIITLNKKETVEEFIKKRKLFKFYLNKKHEVISYDSSSTDDHYTQEKNDIQRIYINEPLTKFNSMLFKKTKLLNSFGYKFIWHKFGKVFARKTNTSKIFHITSLTMVDDLISENCLESKGLNLNLSNTNTQLIPSQN